MKRVFAKLAVIALSAFCLACGSATEVGNPVGQVPTTTIIGTIVVESIPDETETLSAMRILDEQWIRAQDLSVVAETSADDFVEDHLDAEGNFTIRVQINKTYQWQVRIGDSKVGDFSFDQGNGTRANRLRITQEGATIDMGYVEYEDGEFFPEFEPMDLDVMGPM